MPRSSRQSTYTYNDNFRPPPPPGYRGGDVHYQSPEVSPQFLFSFVLGSLLIIYHILHGLLRWPPLLELLFTIVGTVMGQGTREMLQSVFSHGAARSVRTRAASLVGYGDGGTFVGGLWNMGNTCYQNSVLQAMASLSHLKPHLMSLSISEEEDYMNPSGALASLIATLNALSPSPRAFTPSPIIVRGTDNSGWIYNEQQDAQEYFQKLTGALEKEVSRFLERKKRSATRGLEAIAEIVRGERVQDPESIATLEKEYRSPFEGLFAQRVGCLQCGYVESISLQRFTSLSLSLPPTWTCTLEECLEEFTAIEQIQEVDCDKCTLKSLHKQLLSLASTPLSADVQSQIQARIAALAAAIDDDNFDPKIPGVKISPRQKVSTTKTKQTMIARAPQVLVLHLNRSQYDVVTGMTGKNHAAVSFPARMDLGRLGVVTRHDVAEGSWGLAVDPARSMSGRVPAWFLQGSGSGETLVQTPTDEGADTDGATDTEETEAETENEKEKEDVHQPVAATTTLSVNGERLSYDLKSVVAHYGGHHNGHYVCYRKQHGQWFKISDHDV
ncbi:cysteine proteinase [Morchella conica CCBAS932]|uniref:ubiquitinyl hydrolase 1 n=1 Tax=Morchella conica CCBAS932 TaxID=1392247 RepID=A0A3N4KFA6_9PEZI|nr:cysteine proteinase [Morchella conica CCBAS932]